MYILLDLKAGEYYVGIEYKQLKTTEDRNRAGSFETKWEAMARGNYIWNTYGRSFAAVRKVVGV